ncbi:MAG: hypothetical protein JW718_07300, partial [Desulfovibrionaceae bacterium]|nr:hypothetical protein [Desulfovibrionaceae bacterium]
TAEMLRDINPFLRIEVIEEPVADLDLLRELMAGSDLVVEAIDYLGFDHKAAFARAARQSGLLNLTAPIPGFGTLMAIFEPQGMTLEEFFRAPEDPSLWPGYVLPLDRILGEARYGPLVGRFARGEVPYLSTCAGAAALNGGLVATEAALILTGLRPARDIVFAPRVVWLDMLSRTFEVYDPTLEGA